ncbi:MAG: hypothetical protein QM504_05010 [Pseudomonadota bacterium]
MNKHFIAICEEAREKILKSNASVKGMCREVSLAIAYQASKKNIDCCVCFGVHTGAGEVHYWLRIDNTIYDATVSQFGYAEAVFVKLELEAIEYIENGFIYFRAKEINELIKA